MQMEEEKGKEMIEKINDKERKKIKCFPCICLEVGRRMEKKKKQEIVHFLFVLFEKQRNGMFFFKKYFFTFIPSSSGEESKRQIGKIVSLKAIQSQEMWLISPIHLSLHFCPIKAKWKKRD